MHKIKALIKNKKTVSVFLVCALFFIFSLWSFQNNFSSETILEEKVQNPYVVPPLTKKYINSVYKFSLQMPEDFVARELMKESGITVVFENNKAEGIQVDITPFNESALVSENGIKILSTDFIQKSIGDMKIIDSQPVEIGSGYKGVAFKSDNEAFDGASREVWFVFRGNLYQISTYERFDELLKKMFITWSFN